MAFIKGICKHVLYCVHLILTSSLTATLYKKARERQIQRGGKIHDNENIRYLNFYNIVNLPCRDPTKRGYDILKSIKKFVFKLPYSCKR